MAHVWQRSLFSVHCAHPLSYVHRSVAVLPAGGGAARKEKGVNERGGAEGRSATVCAVTSDLFLAQHRLPRSPAGPTAARRHPLRHSHRGMLINWIILY